MNFFDLTSSSLVAALLLAAVVLAVSPSLRARTKVLLQKRLFSYKYDYRKEWLRFTATLSTSGDEPVQETAIRAVAQIVNSPGGIAWAKREDGGSYEPIGSWGCEMGELPSFEDNSSLVRFLRERQWIIDLNELSMHPARYAKLDPASFEGQHEDWWLIVPMFLGERMLGFIVLLRPLAMTRLNFEDHDLLKTVGRQVATHIYQAEADRRLTEAQQFGAYNRLTSFLMHDLNNLVAQQSLVVQNAERFRHNPEFVDDAISTISHSVNRMRRLMGQLSSVSTVPARQNVNVAEAVQNAIQRSSGRLPKPQLKICERECRVRCDPERLTMVVEHLLRNAQEATAETGSVDVSVTNSQGTVTIEISDTGSGMTQDFIRNRLFRPFDTTKGNQGMGIGVYQARDYSRALGGDLKVESEPGTGSVFRINLPLV